MKATNGTFSIDCICENCGQHIMKHPLGANPYWSDYCLKHQMYIKKLHSCKDYELTDFFKKNGYKIEEK